MPLVERLKVAVNSIWTAVTVVRTVVMETCVLIPRQLSIVLLPTGRPGHGLEMGATLWANCTLRPGCTFLPDEGELRLDRLEIFTDLSDKDVSRVNELLSLFIIVIIFS